MAAWNLTGTSGSSASDGGAELPWERADAPGTSPAVEAAGDPSALSVSEAVGLAAGAIDALPAITVLGEVTGFRGPNARSGHCYFQIKDDSAAVDCTIWRGVYSKRAFDLRDGMQVLFSGQFNIYKPQGRMSFIARRFTLAGEGLLRQQVAELARKLEREGLMDSARKTKIPAFCSRVAVVTSLSGAVIDDVKRTLRRRNPLVEIICVGAKVQGAGAPAELIEALRRAAAVPGIDCILLVRGGGSFEDLMTFNDEELARAVAACPVPVVTGIGHEPDTSICDMVSDRRASTPTAAAESVAPDTGKLAELLETRSQRLSATLVRRVDTERACADVLCDRMARAWKTQSDRMRVVLDANAARPCMSDPTSIVDRRRTEIARTEERFGEACERSLVHFGRELDRLASRLPESAKGFADKEHALVLVSARLQNEGRTLLRGHTSDIARFAASLDALSPLKVLGRGYAIAYGEDGVRTSARAYQEGDALRVRFADGDVHATVTGVSADAAPADR